MRVRISDSARRDLLEIALFVAEEDEDRALRLVDTLERQASIIATFPKAHQVVAYHGRPDEVRRRVVGPYLILYRILDREIFVIGFVHGARDLETILRNLET